MALRDLTDPSTFPGTERSARRSRFIPAASLVSTLTLVFAVGGASTPAAAQKRFVVTTLAGKAATGSADGTGAYARFLQPHSVAVDNAGTVYVADTGNATIRKITAGGVVTTFAGVAGSKGAVDGQGNAARFHLPMGIAIDANGTLYVTDATLIRTITPDGVVSTLAGGDSGSADGIGAAAQFSGPTGIAVDAAGTVYVSDTYNHTIRRIGPGGVVTTLAGSPGNAGFANAVGDHARFNWPSGLTVDAAGNVYVADGENHAVRRITPGGVVTTVAGVRGGFGNVDGTGSAARFGTPSGIVADSSGTLYVADQSFNVIRKITPNAVVTTLAGETAGFQQPQGLAVDGLGNLYVADTTNSTIRQIASTGVVTTLAGLSESVGFVNGTGATARFNRPDDVAIGVDGMTYVADTFNEAIRVITAGGMVSTMPGGVLNHPFGVAVDHDGTVYIADTFDNTIRTTTTAGVISTLAGLAGSSGDADGIGSAARFNQPARLAVDLAGNVYVSDTGNHTVRKITPGGIVSTLAGLSGDPTLRDGQGAAARFSSPVGIAVTAAGTIYVADSGNNAIRSITPGGLVSTVAGGSYGNGDGPGEIAGFNNPRGVAVAANGTVYVADTLNNTLRAIDSSGHVTTVAGLSPDAGSTDATGSAARFNGPASVAVDASGNLRIADAQNNTIRKASVLDALVPTVTVSSASFTYDGAAHETTAVATGVGGEPLAGTFSFGYSPAASAGPINAGTYTATASFHSSAPDYANGSGSGTLTINRATPTIAVGAVSFPYDGTAHQLSATALGVDGLAVAGTTAVTYTPGGPNAPVLQGSYSASVTFTSSDPNYNGASTTVAVTVTRGMPTLTFTGSAVYDGSAHAAVGTAHGALGATVPGTFAVNYQPGGTVAPVNVGSYPFTATFISGDPLYDNASGSGAIVVTPARPDITFTTGTYPYDGAAHSVGAVSVTGVGGAAVAGMSAVSYAPGGTQAPVSQGTYVASVAFTSSDPNYSSTVTTGTIVIGPPPPVSFSGRVRAGLGQGIPALAISVSQGTTVVATATTDATGTYAVPQIAAGSYVERVRDIAGTLLATVNITLLQNGPPSVVDVLLSDFTQTLYVSPTGSDSQAGTEAAPLKTFLKAFSVLMPGGELVLLDGVYGEAQGTGSMTWEGVHSAQIPSGLPLLPTYVHAQHPGAVTIMGPLFIGRSSRKDSYIRIEGLTFDAGAAASAAAIYNSSFITIRTSGFHSVINTGGGVFSVGTNDGDWGNTDNLFEDIWVWGRARGIVANYRADRNVWRRMVVRGDGCSAEDCSGDGNPNIGFTVYESANVSVQNVLIVDRVLGGGSPYADFAVAQHTATLSSGNNEWLGTMSINAPDSGYYFEPDQVLATARETVRNCVAWNSAGGGINLARAGVYDVENCTVDTRTGIGIRVAPELLANGGTLRNSIVIGAGEYGISSAYQPSYVDVNGTWTTSTYNQLPCAVGCRTTDPIADGSLKYPLRIEQASALRGAGANGADIGANVQFRYGPDGTRVGDPNMDALTTTPLWPWPNEARIAAEMCAVEHRGFCADSSLTHYVWNRIGQGNPYSTAPPPTDYVGQVMTLAPAAYWRMGEGAGSLGDSTSGGLVGVKHGSPAYGAPGPLGDPTTAIQFNGSNSYFTFGDTYGFAGNTPFSFAFWMYQTAIPAASYEHVLSKQIDGSGNGWFVSIFPNTDPSRGRLSFQRNVAGSNLTVNTVNALTLNRWNLVVGTYDGRRMRLYLNGVQQGTGTANTLPLGASTNPFTIGKNAHYNANFFSGRLKDAAIVSGRALSQTEVSALYALRPGAAPPNPPTTYAEQVMALPPTDYWRMGEAGGNLADSTGNGVVGTRRGTPTYGLPGPSGDNTTAVQFNGSNSAFTFGDNFGFPGTASFSFAFWMYQAAVPASSYEHVISKQIDGSGNGWFVSVFPSTDPGAGGLSFQRNVGGTNVTINTKAALPLNRWNMVVGTYDGTRMHLYLNGVEQGTGTAATLPLAAGTNPFTIGKNAQFNANFYSGRLKDMAIVSGRALSQAEIAALYRWRDPVANAPLTGYAAQLVSLAPAAFWRMADGGGDLADTSGHAMTGTQHGSPTYNVPGPFADGSTAVQFGSGSNFTFGDTFGFSGTASYSFAFWIYQSAIPATVYEHVLSKQIDGAANGWFVSLFPNSDPSRGRLSFQRNVAGTNVTVNTANPLPLNQWNLIVGTFDGTRMRLYVNGIQQGTGTATTLALGASTNPFTIGKNAHFNANYFTGRLKDVAIVTGRALSQVEITALYAAR